jgi:hypothetical protein
VTDPVVVCAYARKYEPQFMVDDLCENCAWVDGFVELDQRDRVDELWSRRDERVAELRSRAEREGADWCLIMDPDERLERSAEEEVRRVVAGDPSLRYTFPLLELWTPQTHRIDGPWGRKTRRRLFHLRAPMSRRVLLDTVLMFHLKMVEPENRHLRAEVHRRANTWDNRTLGFDYLEDERGAVLQPLPPGRGFDPPYRPYKFEVPERLLRDE